ncbi:MAG: hypothetical protein ACKVX9_21910 [Blastocatellia bacterium]
MTMLCQFCGARLQQLARYCKNCGARVGREKDDPAPVSGRDVVPAQDDGDIPWRPDETALILPIEREFPRESPWGAGDGGDSAEIVPIDPWNAPSARRENPPSWVEILEEETIPPPQSEDAWDPRPEIQEYFAPAPARREPPRERRSAMPLLVLLVAVLLLFVFAYLVWQGA